MINYLEKRKVFKDWNFSGIYHIYVINQKTKQKYSYAGVSKNIKNRIGSHYSWIKKYFNLEGKNQKETLHSNMIPASDVFYWKINALTMIVNLMVLMICLLNLLRQIGVEDDISCPGG